ncbi:MAG: nucleoside hydrolase [Bacteroidales bacterium]|nr:nucleoside hydrolase [Bacteroidales bacterium]
MNKLRLYIIVFFSAMIGGITLAHEGIPDHHLIIDTDGAHDDMRAITMLLAVEDMRTLAITCSQGSLTPDSVYVKVKSLLHTLHHEGIPVGTGESSDQKLPAWGGFAQGIQWGSRPDLSTLNIEADANIILNTVSRDYEYKFTLVALGSLKTFADWLKTDPGLTGRIDHIIWYNDHNIEEGFNYQCSPESFEYIKNLGIELDIISNPTKRLPVNSDYLESIAREETVYSQAILAVHKQPAVVERIEENHLQLWDDLIPVFMEVPLVFESRTEGNISFLSLLKHVQPTSLYTMVSSILSSSDVPLNRVFKEFPLDADLYKTEYAEMMESTLRDYGRVEWKAIAMTNEIHGHTGIYSIIGAKMGIRATEYFNVGINSMTVITYAGNKPPLSCFNDGIQISTGCTIGQGLITISDSISTIPTALFEFNKQKVLIVVKPEIARQMQADIKYGVQEYGLLSDQYWTYIEQLAIKYWSSYDRDQIFELHAFTNQGTYDGAQSQN